MSVVNPPFSSERDAVAVAACSFAMPDADASAGAGALLRRVQFFPAGEFRSGDTRPEEVPAWRLDAASAARVVQRFGARGGPMVVDYEHQTLNKEKNGQPAPAAGWVTELGWAEGEGLFGLVRLTARAGAAVDAGEYRFFSPVFRYSPADGTVLEVLMGALTNDPGIQGMAQISLTAAATAAFLSSPKELRVNALLEAVVAALGLPKDCTEEAALAAVTAQGFAPQGVVPDAPGAGAGQALAQGAPDPAQFVPVQLLAQLQGQVAQLTAQLEGDKAEGAISAARAQGRLITAGQEAHARAIAKSGGMAALTAFLEVLTPVAALVATQTGGRAPTGVDDGAANAFGLSADELAVAAACGMSPEVYAKGKA